MLLCGLWRREKLYRAETSRIRSLLKSPTQICAGPMRIYEIYEYGFEPFLRRL